MRIFGIFLAIVFAAIADVCAQTSLPMPVNLSLEIGNAADPNQLTKAMQIVILLTVLSLAPSFLVMVTSFTRIVVVISFLKRAISAGQHPAKEVVAGLAIFLTIYIMMPTWKKINEQSLQPYLKKEISSSEALHKGLEPLRHFMFRQTREKDLALFVHLTKQDKPKSREEVPTSVLIPAFIISELNTAFQMGFIIFLPFLVIDMVVSSVLLSMGMMMLPPVMVSMPFKLLLFVMVDGWQLIIRSLTMGFHS